MGVTFKNTPKGNATTVKTITDGKTKNVLSEDMTQEVVEMPMMQGMALEAKEAVPFAEVSYAAGFTKGLPNYSAARVDVSLKMPCSVESIDEAYEFAEQWVTSRLEKQFEEL